jgi:hypothetical protein
MSILTKNLNTDQVCGNCDAWETDPFGKGWIGNCPFDQVLYTFSKKCENDRWVPKYDCEVIKWCRKYAEQGNAQAQYCLGMIYESEKPDYHNLELAYMWLSLASIRGHADAVKQIKELERKMTLSEIERAKNLAKE